MAGTDQWIRKVSLLVLPSSDPYAATEKALDLSQFRIRFKTFQAEGQRLGWAYIRVTNLAPDTEKKFIQEYNSIQLQAGYETGKFGVIFMGQITQYRRGHESVTDSFLDIYAVDGDGAACFSVINQTLAAGYTSKDEIKAATDALKPQGVQLGVQIQPSADAVTAGLSANARGKTIWGNGLPALGEATRNAGLTYSIVGNKANIIPFTGYLPGEAIKLSGATGLIGWPEQTNNGIDVKCLLNPAIRIRNIVQIDNKAINYTVAPGGGFEIFSSQGAIGAQPGAHQYFMPVTDDGFYMVLVIEHEGDTRGNPWYTSLTCVTVDATQAVASNGQTGADDHDVVIPPPMKDNLPTGDQPDNDPTSPFYSPPEPAGPPEPIGPPVPSSSRGFGTD